MVIQLNRETARIQDFKHLNKELVDRINGVNKLNIAEKYKRHNNVGNSNTNQNLYKHMVQDISKKQKIDANNQGNAYNQIYT